VSVDGSDLTAVMEAAADTVAAIRAGEGPRLLHARTYRWEGHTSTDPAAYRSAAELAAGKARDPLARFAPRLIASGVEPAAIARLEADAAAEMLAARDAARAAPPPDPSEAYEDVQDDGAPAGVAAWA
jgi:TPP-dependent pyruvate/acetoin dehydrogenase alpha subunit